MSHHRTTSTWPLGEVGDLTSAWGDLAVDLADAYQGFLGAMAPAANTMTEQLGRQMTRRRPRSRHHAQEPTRCPACRSDGCHCSCCVNDADLVVHARLGERRIVPVRISNERTRTRQISLELSSFTTSGGREVPVTGEILTPTEFELEACAHEDAVVGLRTDGSQDLEPRDAEAQDIEAGRQAGRLLDVDDCTVGYADLRIQGCDVRPVRLAIVLLPRDCAAHEVHCSCGCC